MDTNAINQEIKPTLNQYLLWVNCLYNPWILFLLTFWFFNYFLFVFDTRFIILYRFDIVNSLEISLNNTWSWFPYFIFYIFLILKLFFIMFWSLNYLEIHLSDEIIISPEIELLTFRVSSVHCPCSKVAAFS